VTSKAPATVVGVGTSSEGRGSEKPPDSLFGAARATVSDWLRRRRGEEPKGREPVRPGKLEELGVAKEDPGDIGYSDETDQDSSSV
jgi:hypothetical protein